MGAGMVEHGGRSLLGVWSHPEFEFLRGDAEDAKIDPVRKDVGSMGLFESRSQKSKTNWGGNYLDG
jgi:hypothetical protein